MSDCDGLEVTNAALGPAYPEGLFIAQDGSNPGANQSFKLVPWCRIADALSPNVQVDTSWDPRQVGATGGGMDAGTPPSDAGTPADAGTQPDAGMQADAGGASAPVDAGGERPSSDAGSSGGEEGPGTPDDTPVTGCARAPASLGTLALLALTSLAGARRRSARARERR